MKSERLYCKVDLTCLTLFFPISTFLLVSSGLPSSKKSLLEISRDS